MHARIVQHFSVFLLIAVLTQESLQLSPLRIKSDSNKQHFIELFFKANWFKANQFCKFHGMELLTLDTQREISALKSGLKSAGINERLWTGGNDLAETGQYSWAANGNWNPIVTDWLPGEPNSPGVEHCVELFGAGNDYKWNNERCATELYFICQSEESNTDCIK